MNATSVLVVWCHDCLNISLYYIKLSTEEAKRALSCHRKYIGRDTTYEKDIEWIRSLLTERGSYLIGSEDEDCHRIDSVDTTYSIFTGDISE